MNSFRSVDAVSNILSNLEMVRETGRVCLNVVLFLIPGNPRDSVIICLNTTITQKTSVYQNIWMTGYSDRYVIVNVAHNVFMIWPIS